MAPVVEVVEGDITKVPADAVVNAANHRLVPGGGVDGAIHRAAGKGLARACQALGGCDPGDAKATPGFNLPARWVIHTVGPVWSGGREAEVETLASCYRRSLEVAEGLGARSVAFPAISTGAYGFPPDVAASTAVSAVRSRESRIVRRVLLVAFDEGTRRLYQGLLTDRAGEPS